MEHYETLGTIGEGTYGVVMKARHRETGMIVAIKRFKESEEDEQVRKTSLREIRVLKKLRHENVVALLDIFRREGKLFLVFEFVEHTILELLDQNTEGLNPEDVRRYTYQLLRATEYCHSHNVIHRDIKPENILIDQNGLLKLCDFGFARTMNIKGNYTDYVATRWYRAPELLVGDTEYTHAVDVWAVGCIMAELINGKPLFPGESDPDQIAHIVRCTGPLTNSMVSTFRRNPLYTTLELPQADVVEPLELRFPQIPPSQLEFLHLCLENDPDARASCIHLMSLPYFTDNNFQERYEEQIRSYVESDRLKHNCSASFQSFLKQPPVPSAPSGPPGSSPLSGAPTRSPTLALNQESGSLLPPPMLSRSRRQDDTIPDWASLNGGNPSRTASPVHGSFITSDLTSTTPAPHGQQAQHAPESFGLGALWSQYLHFATAPANSSPSPSELPRLRIAPQGKNIPVKQTVLKGVPTNTNGAGPSTGSLHGFSLSGNGHAPDMRHTFTALAPEVTAKHMYIKKNGTSPGHLSKERSSQLHGAGNSSSGFPNLSSSSSGRRLAPSAGPAVQQMPGMAGAKPAHAPRRHVLSTLSLTVLGSTRPNDGHHEANPQSMVLFGYSNPEQLRKR